MRIVRVPGVFQPPSDAWLLADYLRRERLAAGATVLDLCAGSGILAIAAALGGATRATAIDISRPAAAAIRLNALLNGVKVEALRGDLFGPVEGRRFDLILSNPPYLPGDTAELPRSGLARAWEGGRSGRAFIERIAAGARDHLTPEGVLVLTYSTVCDEPKTLAALRAGGLAPKVVVRCRGPLGTRLSARVDWLRSQGVLLAGDEEEILVVRADATPAGSASRSPGHRRSTSSPAQAPAQSARAREAASLSAAPRSSRADDQAPSLRR
jgi:release factor glutamine methyltransferase